MVFLAFYITGYEHVWHWYMSPKLVCKQIGTEDPLEKAPQSIIYSIVTLIGKLQCCSCTTLRGWNNQLTIKGYTRRQIPSLLMNDECQLIHDMPNLPCMQWRQSRKSIREVSNGLLNYFTILQKWIHYAILMTEAINLFRVNPISSICSPFVNGRQCTQLIISRKIYSWPCRIHSYHWKLSMT
jgi:hypothetical protein